MNDRKKIFSSVLDKLTGIYGSDVPEFVKDVEARKIYISELYDTFSKGHVPNFAYKLKKRKQYENDKKNNFNISAFSWVYVNKCSRD